MLAVLQGLGGTTLDVPAFPDLFDDLGTEGFKGLRDVTTP